MKKIIQFLTVCSFFCVFLQLGFAQDQDSEGFPAIRYDCERLPPISPLPEEAIGIPEETLGECLESCREDLYSDVKRCNENEAISWKLRQLGPIGGGESYTSCLDKALRSFDLCEDNCFMNCK